MTGKLLTATFIVTLAPAAVSFSQDRPRVPQGPAGTVTLPIGEYNRLLDRASQPDTTPESPPVAAVVGRAELHARVEGSVARGTLHLDGEVFQRGQVRVPLVSGTTLIDAKSDGRVMPLFEESGIYKAVLPGPAPFAVTLEWAAAVTLKPGYASFTLPMPTGASVSATVDLPGDPANLSVVPGVITRRQTAGGRTILDVTLTPESRAVVAWYVREAATTAVPVAARTLADVKTLVTIGDADVRMVSLIDVTVVQGEPGTFEIRIPAGFDVSSISGNSIETSDVRGAAIALNVRLPSARRHQFLVALERPHAPGSFRVDTSFPTVTGVQREAGESAIEGSGTIDVSASGDERLRRMDVRETHAALRSLTREPLIAAFRYQRRPEETRTLTLDVKRFADAPVVAAVAERAVATTLVTTEGRTLTEVVLRIRNRAQPFMKVTLPPGATMLSVEVAGQAAKPVTGADGTRVPLLRAGFRPDGAYEVSFVYLHAGDAFASRGDAQMALARFDVPANLLEWELFLPDRYSAKPTGGNVIPVRLMPPLAFAGAPYVPLAGEVAGRVLDASGVPLPGVSVTVTSRDGSRREATTDAGGIYAVRGVPSGPVTITCELAGFGTVRRSIEHNQARPRTTDIQMEIAGVTETVTVLGQETKGAYPQPKNAPAQMNVPSQQVLNLQRRIAGVLPVRVDVPRSGTSYRFVRPLLLDEETSVTFRYKKR